MNNQLLKYGAKDHFFRAVLCRMCRDLDDAAVGLQRYEEMFPVFADARECKLVKVRLVENNGGGGGGLCLPWGNAMPIMAFLYGVMLYLVFRAYCTEFYISLLSRHYYKHVKIRI